MLDKELMRRIVSENDDILNDSNLFNELMSIHFSHDRLMYNLLSVSYNEKIPHMISSINNYSPIVEKRFVDMLIAACTCNQNMAKEVVYLWEYAYGVDMFSNILSTLDKENESFKKLYDLSEDLKCYPVEVLGLSDNKNRLLHANNIDTIRDLLCLSKKELLSINGIGKKACSKINDRLYDHYRWSLGEESDQHFNRFYTESLREIYEKKEDNWEYHFYVCSMIKIYDWIEKYRKSYKALAYKMIEKDIIGRSIVEILHSEMIALSNLIDLYNSNYFVKFINDSYVFIDVLQYIENIYLFLKKLIIWEAEVDVALVLSRQEEGIYLVKKLSDSIFSYILDHRIYLVGLEGLFGELTDVPQDKLQLIIEINNDIIGELDELINKMLKRYNI